ncbi:hypothetical protein [Paenibacillus sp.]|uniref:hypothetical protein n=1 Tax=Paenibacillus sp. TaxID=58172 RepID=UPI002D7508FA|nr:hypothetical protein [Paenibacillus sp.]HZG87741.1 hypothetical protein [Paenibacillus sp.]
MKIIQNGTWASKVGAAGLAGFMLFGCGAGALDAAAAAKTAAEAKETGRTEQQRMTGAISPDFIPTLAHYATDVVLTGTVTIDGPKLVLLVNGQDVSASAQLTKIGDRTWTYRYPTSVGSQTGDVAFNVDAYTVYMNGKTAGAVHTRAASAAAQVVHVPFIKYYEYTNLSWDAYDRVSNLFSFSYQLVKVWDDEVREVVAEPTLAQVAGDAVYAASGFEIAPPVVLRDFALTAAEPVWTYEAPTYSVDFAVEKTYSNGAKSSETVQRAGLLPGTSTDVTVTLEGWTKTFTLAAPAAPAAPAPSIPAETTGVVDESGIESTWTGTSANGGNVQQNYTLRYTINGTSFEQKLQTNFTKNGTGFTTQQLVYLASYEGQTVKIVYALPFVQPASLNDNTTNKS